MLRSREKNNISNQAKGHDYYSLFSWSTFLLLRGYLKIPLVLLAFAITLKGINTLRENQRTKENQDMILQVQREKLS